MSLDINSEDVLTWETKKLWNTVNTLRNDPDVKLKIEPLDYEQCKYGIRIKCPIWYFTEEWYEIYPSSKKVKITGYGKYDLPDFMQEKEERDNLLRTLIVDNIDDNGMIEGRV
jgi:hypothetical protein